MFDHYSIAGASLPHDPFETDDMDDNISPTSSRTTTPTPDETDMYDIQQTTDTVAELSNRFKQQSLRDRRQRLPPMHPSTPLPPALNIEPPTLPLRSSRRRSSSLLVWQQRQSMTRRQCTPAQLSQISKLVEELSQDVNPCYNTTHPSSSDTQAPLSPTSNPSSFGSLESTPTSSGSEDCGPEITGSSRRMDVGRIDKESRKRSTAEVLDRKQKLVLKKVRMRKSLNRLRTAT
ncbi:MAG: hypothetical protein LQ338_000989 [Usnochroma carphineum]|nr:MAG: hypothetical protein LQ338_000989 [Usnochroma carphineum]